MFLQVLKKPVFKLLSLKFLIELNRNSTFKALTLFRLGLFGAAHGWGDWVWQKVPLPKICGTSPVAIKLGIVIPYPKKIQKICESRDLPLSSADISIFHWKSANFAISRKWIAYWCIIFNSFNFFLVFKDCCNKHGCNFDNVSKNDYSRSS